MAPKVGDTVFVDTNVFLTATDRGRTSHADSKTVIARSAACGIHLAVSGQVLREYMVVATRPVELNGLGLRNEDALTNVGHFLRHTIFLEETQTTARHLRELVREHGVQGKRIHDANITATMLTHGVELLLTLNPRDFAGMPGIVTTAPDRLARFLSSPPQ